MRSGTAATVAVFLAWAVLVAAAGAADIVIVKGDQRPVVIVRRDAGSEARTSALEVSHYIGKITGRTPPVVLEGFGVYVRRGRHLRPMPFAKAGGKPTGTPEIHVGWTALALKSIDRKKVEALDMDGFLIRTTPKAIFLVGPKDWSTGYACGEFLSRLCGVRWYLPGEFGEDVPSKEVLTVPTVDRTFEPAYKHRQYSGFQWRDHAELRRWGQHARIRARLQYHHNLYRVFDVRKYGKKHPDLYGMLRGRRRVPGPKTVSGWQPCLTHPMAVEVAMDYAREFFRKDPDAGSISLGINDGGRYCECDRCMKTVDTTLPPQGDRGRWFFDFANKVAEGFDKEFPDKQIGYLLYGHCKVFPKGMKIHPRLIGFYVSPSFNLITPEGKQAYDEGLAELTKSVSRFALYDWFYGDGVAVPRMQIRQAKYWLEHGYKMGARHCKAEAYMNWGLDGFKYWMHAKLLWDPSLSVDDMMDDFFPRFFKESAGPMREYFKIVEEYTVKPIMMRLEDKDGKPGELRAMNFRFRYPEQLLTFPPEAAERCLPHLDKAEKMATSHIVRERVRYFRMAFDVSRMLTYQYHYAKDALPLLQKPETLPQGMPLLAKALSKDLDVEQYYAWVLRNDAFCVREPERRMFGGVTLARSAAAKTLSDQVIAELRGFGKKAISPAALESIVSQRLGQAMAGIKSAEHRDVAKVAIEPYARKIMLCNRGPAPKVDGKLDDPCWRDSVAYSGFTAAGKGVSSENITEVRLAHDGKRLYLGYTCYQDTELIVAWTKERDGRLWREDGIEFLLNRPTDTVKTQNFQIIANTRGNIYDSLKGDVKWDGDIKVAADVQPEFYTIEVSVPLKEIGIDPVKDRFLRVNFVRNFYGKVRGKIGAPTEVSTWNLTPFGNLDPRARGWLVFN